MAQAPTTWLAPSADGRLELFVVGIPFGSDAGIALWHQWQTAPSNGWSGWASHGAPGKFNNWNGPGLARNSQGRLELFMVFFGTVWQQWQTAANNGWSSWASHGTPPGVNLTGYPTLGRSPDGRLELFVVGVDGALWHKWQTAPGNGWSSWTSHGVPQGSGGLRLRPAVAPSADGRLELFVSGSDGALWHIWQITPGGGWSSWLSHGRPSGNELDSLAIPAIAPSADGRLEVFAVSDDGALWHIWQTAANNGWSNWTSHGSPPGVKFKFRGPALAPSADGRLELFIVGDDGALWHIWQTAANNGWSGWTSHGKPPPSTAGGPPIGLLGYPAIAPNSQGRLELFIAGDDNALWHIWQTAPSNGWSAWASHGHPSGVGFFGA